MADAREKRPPPPDDSQARSDSALQPRDDSNLDLHRSSLRADSDTLPSLAPSPSPPAVPLLSQQILDNAKRKGRSRGRAPLATSQHGSKSSRNTQFLLEPESWINLYDFVEDSSVASSSPNALERLRTRESSTPSKGSRQTRTSKRRRRLPPSPSSRRSQRPGSESRSDITALPNMISTGTSNVNHAEEYARSRASPSAQKLSRFATEFYTVSYLIFFSIWGTLARLGLQALTFYPGAPVVFSELWANVAGTFVIGFLVEDGRIFREEWGNRLSPTLSHLETPNALPDMEKNETTQQSKAKHGKVKKTIPLYIGLATGFCGSFTSFSSFIRDVFLALSNDLKSPINHPYPTNAPTPAVSTTVSRNGGYSFMAILATIIVTIATCYAAFKVGSHLANLLDPITPTLPFRTTRRILDPFVAFLAWGTWLGAVLMAILPPLDAWRSQALFACVLTPLGCLARHYASQRLNPLVASFPVGTFTVNMLGTAILAMAYDLQRVPLHSVGIVGGSVIGCQVLQGVMDGFCGAFTTVSTWITELDSLKRRHAYFYGATSVAIGLCLSVLIMGSVKWTVGWQAIICIT